MFYLSGCPLWRLARRHPITGFQDFHPPLYIFVECPCDVVSLYNFFDIIYVGFWRYKLLSFENFLWNLRFDSPGRRAARRESDEDMAASVVQASHLGTSIAVQPCSCRDVEGPSKRVTSGVASFSGLSTAAKCIPLSSSLGDSAAAQRHALRRPAFGSSSVTSGGRKAVVCMAGEGTLVRSRLEEILNFLTA